MSWFNAVTVILAVVAFRMGETLWKEWRSRRREPAALPHRENLDVLKQAAVEGDALPPSTAPSRAFAIAEFYRKTVATTARLKRKKDPEPGGKKSGIVVEVGTPAEFVREVWGFAHDSAVYTLRVRLDEEDRWAAWELHANGHCQREGVGSIEVRQ